MKYQDYLLEEYKKNNAKPVYLSAGKKKLLVPCSYKGNSNKFLEDLFSFQDDYNKEYDDYNKKHPETSIKKPKPIRVGDFFIEVPLKNALQDHHNERIISDVMATAYRNISRAVTRTQRAKKQYPNSIFLVSLSKEEKHKLFWLDKEFKAKKVAEVAYKITKFGVKQTASITVGALGALPAAAYFFLNKKYRFAKNNFHSWVDKKALPEIQKGVLKLAVLSAVYGGYKGYQKNTEKAQTATEAEHLDNSYYGRNYKKAKEIETKIFAIIACSEGFKEDAYLCSAKVPTIAYGNTVLDGGARVKLGMFSTREAGKENVVYHLEKHVYPALKHIKKDLTEGQIAAICSFVYNTGKSDFETSLLCKTINQTDDVKKVREAFSMYRKAGGKRNYGVINANGLKGLLYEVGIDEFLKLDIGFFGSKHIKYYKNKPRSRNPYENPDKSFVLRPSEDVIADLKKHFSTDDPNKTILGLLPKLDQEVLKKDLCFNIEKKAQTSMKIAQR